MNTEVNVNNNPNKKKIFIIIGISIIILAIIIFIVMGFIKNKQPKKTNMEVNYPVITDETVTYENRIFDTNYMHLVDVKISEEDWQDLIENPLNKTKYKVDVEIDGITFKDVSFKTKGNSSLQNIASGPKGGPASNRYSFKINFSKYIKTQTYYGLDKLNLNNIYGDATYLNDFMSYEVFKAAGVATPLVSYTVLRINGEDFGVYLAIEEISNSFFYRNNLIGNLYKPEQTENGENGAALKYKDDDINSYSDIFDNAENSVSEEDKMRLIQSLKKLYNNEDLEDILDTNEVISYFVAHNYLLSYDSYTGPSIHNYYLTELNGKLKLLPWDYNLAFGRFSMTEDSTFITNFGIDSPLYKAREEERPMWKWIIENDTYLNIYHEKMNSLINDYFEKGLFTEKIDKTYSLIKEYVDQDPSAFYSPQEVEQAVKTLKEFSNYRTQSIKKQLNQELSSNTREQNNNEKVDASSINLEYLGLIARDQKER